MATRLSLDDLRSSARKLAEVDRKMLRLAQMTASQELVVVRKAALDYFIKGEAFPTELKDYHDALDAVVKSDTPVEMPVRPVIDGRA